MKRPSQAHLDPVGRELVRAPWRIASRVDFNADAMVIEGDALKEIRALPDQSIQLVISSPPYNIGKEYETPVELEEYLEGQAKTIRELHRTLRPGGSLCWQVGNYVIGAESFPLDIYYYPIFKKLALKLRNRIIWHFGHGTHPSRRFSPRYETLLWFTKGDEYTFNLDDVRVRAKYPGKTHYKGPKAGKPSGNPLGKNPSDFWEALHDEFEGMVWEIPHVKAAHPEKTSHPCQFPVELVERCVLAFTSDDDWVLDPYGGVGSAAVAALRRGRRAISVEKEAKYVQIALRRLRALEGGSLRVREMGTPVMQPSGREKWSRVPEEWKTEAVRTIY